MISVAKSLLIESGKGRGVKLLCFSWTGREQEIIDEILAKEMGEVREARVDW